jgi:hypothetical protein
MLAVLSLGEETWRIMKVRSCTVLVVLIIYIHICFNSMWQGLSFHNQGFIFFLIWTVDKTSFYWLRIAKLLVLLRSHFQLLSFQKDGTPWVCLDYSLLKHCASDLAPRAYMNWYCKQGNGHAFLIILFCRLLGAQKCFRLQISHSVFKMFDKNEILEILLNKMHQWFIFEMNDVLHKFYPKNRRRSFPLEYIIF